MVEVGQTVPDFSFEATNGIKAKLSDYQGQKVVLYFYPKDRTPGCTLEGMAFRSNMDAFKKANTVVFGISRDSMESHDKFKDKHCFPFELISDPNDAICNLFDVIQDKNFFGKKIRGIVRSTFLIDEKGVLTHEWRKVKVLGHVDEVLNAIL